MSGIGGHVNQGDRARRAQPPDTLDTYLEDRLLQWYRARLDTALEQYLGDLTGWTPSGAAPAPRDD